MSASRGADLESRRLIVAAVGIRPEKAIGDQPLDQAAEIEVELGIGRNLDVEVLVPALAALRDERLDLIEPSGVERPAQRDLIATVQTPGRSHRLPAQLSHEIMKRQVDSRLADRLTGRERGRDRVIHHGANGLQVKRVAANQLRSQVAADGRVDRFQGLVTPAWRGHALAPTDRAVVSRDLHQYRWPPGRLSLRPLEKLEPAHRRVNDREGLDAGDLDVHGGVRPQGPRRAACEATRGGLAQESAAGPGHGILDDQERGLFVPPRD